MAAQTALQTGKGVRKYGFILDGFPRSVGQADLLDKMLSEMEMSIDHVVALEVATEDLMARVLGRRIHKPSGRSYHLTFKPPKVDGKDDVTGEALESRSDDTEETMGARVATFESQTRPVLDHYKSKLLVVKGDNKQSPAAVASAALDMLKSGCAPPASPKRVAKKHHLVVTGPPAGGKGSLCEAILHDYPGM